MVLRVHRNTRIQRGRTWEKHRGVRAADMRCPRCGHALNSQPADLRPSWLPDPLEEPTVPVWPVVGRVLGRKCSAILELARRDRLPVRVLRVGRSYRVATAELLRVLGYDELGAERQEDRHDLSQ
jgi:hypothetical protein